MDVAALALNIDSSTVLKAANDLDRFTAAAQKAGVAAGNPAGSIAKLVAVVQSMDSKLGQMVAGLDRANAALSGQAAAAGRAAVANDNHAASLRRAAAAALEAAQSQQRAQQASATLGGAYASLAAQIGALSVAQTQFGNAIRQADAHVEAYRAHLASLPPAAQAAQDSVQRLGQGATASANAMRANTGNIAAQFQDIGVTAAMGMSPLLIALQQGTQLSAVFAQSGGGALATIRAAFASVFSPVSLLTIAIVAGAAALIQWAMEAASASSETDKLGKAIEGTQLTTYAFSDAQNALGGVIDLTTGKINTQSEALMGLARAQLELIRANAIKDQADARRTIAEQRGRNTPTVSRAGGAAGTMSLTGIGLTGGTTANETQRLLDLFTSGKSTSTQAIDGLERLRKAGKLTEDQFIRTTGAIANFGVAQENMNIYQQSRAALNGDAAALEPFLNRPDPRRAPRAPRTDADRFADIVSRAEADTATQRTREEAVALRENAEAIATMEQRQKLLNDVQTRGITITEGMRAEIERLAGEYGKASASADRAQALFDIGLRADDQQRALVQVRNEVGLYGEALARARFLREMLNAAEDAGIPITATLTADYEARAAAMARVVAQTDRLQFMEGMRRDAIETSASLDAERTAMQMNTRDAIAFTYVQDELARARQANITLTMEEIAAIEQAGKVYADRRYELDRMAQGMADQREIYRGFFTDLTSGLRNGGNAFSVFADAATNALNRVIDKLLDRTLDGFLDSLLPSKSLRLAADVTGQMNANPELFANGGAFTNSVVSSPTLFRFAKGTKLGEMGEAGPEAIMPLVRGSNGSLGVQAQGGGGGTKVVAPDIRIENHNNFQGAVMPADFMAMIQQGDARTVEQVKRQLTQWMQELDTNGAVV